MKKIMALAALIMTGNSQAATLDEQQQQQVKQLVRETLLEQPEIFIDVVNELKKREDIARTQAMNSALTSSNAELFHNPNDPFGGAAKPELSIVYFGDINCGYCKRQSPVLSALIKRYPNLRIIYKDLPILGPSSREAAALSLAARALANGDNDAYLTLHHQFITYSGRRHDNNSIADAVNSQGLDLQTLQKAVNSTINQQLDSNIKLAQRLGITGTPALVFPDEIVAGFVSEDDLQTMIVQRLNR